MFVNSSFRYSGWRYRKKLHQKSYLRVSFGLNWCLHIFFAFVPTVNFCILYPEIFWYLYPMNLCNLYPEIFVFFKCMNLCNLCPRTSSQHLYPELFCICILASLHLHPEIFAFVSMWIFATFVYGIFLYLYPSIFAIWYPWILAFVSMHLGISISMNICILHPCVFAFVSRKILRVFYIHESFFAFVSVHLCISLFPCPYPWIFAFCIHENPSFDGYLSFNVCMNKYVSNLDWMVFIKILQNKVSWNLIWYYII